MPTESRFQEAPLRSTPIRNLGLTITGTRLEPIVKAFEAELDQAGITKVRPYIYLSTEWGVPFGTIALAIPFYLTTADLSKLHTEQTEHIEGYGRQEMLRYLRHEMGHVINYAYKLYEDETWVKHFGSMTQPYLEEYRPEPFSKRYVRHLPGWYAQKHPDEDWAETFAVWLTPGSDWKNEYAGWPALAKLSYVQKIMAKLVNQEPLITSTALDEAVDKIDYSVNDFYQKLPTTASEIPVGLDAALRTIFEDLGTKEDRTSQAERLPASKLLWRIERDVIAQVYRWTGHAPERTRLLMQHLRQRCRQLKQVYPADQERDVVLAVTTLVTALAMNHVHRGSYLP